MQAISIRSVSYLTIDGKVGALIERDTDVVPGRYKLGYDREGTPIIFAKQLVQDWRVARMLGLLFTTLPRKRKRPQQAFATVFTAMDIFHDQTRARGLRSRAFYDRSKIASFKAV